LPEQSLRNDEKICVAVSAMLAMSVAREADARAAGYLAMLRRIAWKHERGPFNVEENGGRAMRGRILPFRARM
jgi:hypothetical protein